MKPANVLAITLISIAALGFAPHSQAASGNVRTSKTTITTSTQESEDDPTANTDSEQSDFIVQKVFGSKSQSGTNGCKTEAKVEQVKADLEKQCHVWQDRQKTSLGSKYQTGTCNDECDDCGMSLQRCRVTGVVHYVK